MHGPSPLGTVERDGQLTLGYISEVQMHQHAQEVQIELLLCVPCIASTAHRSGVSMLLALAAKVFTFLRWGTTWASDGTADPVAPTSIGIHLQDVLTDSQSHNRPAATFWSALTCSPSVMGLAQCT